MNNRWLLTWLTLEPAWLRAATAAGAALLLMLLIGYGWLTPAVRQQHGLEQQQSQRIHQNRIALQSLIDLPSQATSAQRVASLEQQLLPARAQRFSLPALLKASGAKLERWQPSEKGGQLALALSWSQFLAVLEYLVTLQPAPAIPRLSVQRQEALLHLDIELTYEE